MDISKFLEDGLKKEQDIKVTPPVKPARRKYDEQIVAWFDILGMREKIKDQDNYDAEKILTIMGKFQTYVRNSCDNLDITFMQISDGIILVSEYNNLNEICEILCQVQWKVLVHDNMIIRGALTSGKVTTEKGDPSIIIGPALIDAFEIESENAIFPRIIISYELYKVANFNYITKDSDHLYYLDFIEYIIKTEKFNTKKLLHILRTSKVINYLKDEYNKFIQKNKRVAQKYGWLIEKLSSKQIKVL